MRSLPSLVCMAMMLASCETTAPTKTAEERFAPMASEFRAYIKCGYSSARVIVAKNKSASPEFVRDAAAVTCEPERIALAWKIDANYDQGSKVGVLRVMDSNFQKSVSLGAVDALTR